MAVLEDILSEELQRIERIEAAYTEELYSLPKGVLVRKNIAGGEYYYLQYREGNKIISKYIKPENKNETSVSIERRKSLQVALKRINKDKVKIERMLKNE